MEGEMRALNAIRGIFTKLAGRIATYQQLSYFKCGDCESSEQCGKLPSEDCIARATQIERDGDISRSPAPRGYQASY
jgi:hypothetical protein